MTNVGPAPKAPPPRPARAPARTTSSPGSARAAPARGASSGSARAAPARATSGASRPAVAARPAPRRVPEPEEPEADEPQEEEEEDWRPKRPDPAPAPAARPKAAEDETANYGAAQETLDEARALMDMLTPFDKLAVGGVGLLTLSAFLPWRVTSSVGDEVGLLTGGFFAVLLGLASVGALVARLRKLLPNLPAGLFQQGQLGLLALSALVCLGFIIGNYDGTQVPALEGNGTMRVSTPSLGAFLGLMGAGAGVVGSMLGLLGQRR